MIFDPLKCGSCGGEHFMLKHFRDADDPRLGGEGAGGTGKGIAATCVKCGCRSTIKITPPKLIVEGDEKGSLCGGWHENHRR